MVEGARPRDGVKPTTAPAMEEASGSEIVVQAGEARLSVLESIRGLSATGVVIYATTGLPGTYRNGFRCRTRFRMSASWP